MPMSSSSGVRTSSPSIGTSFPSAIEYRDRYVDKEVVPRYLYDLNRVSCKVYSRLDKNEFQIFAKGILKHLLTFNFRRAAASFNHLIELSVGTGQEPEKRLHNDLLKIKENFIDNLINSNEEGNIEGNLSQEFSSKIEKLTMQLELVYDNYFRT